MSPISAMLDTIPSRLSTLGAGEDAINRPYSGGDSPPFEYSGGDSPVDMTPLQSIFQPATHPHLSPVGVQVDLPEITKTYGMATPAPATSGGVPQVAVQPSTETQIFNLANIVAKGFLDVYQIQAQTKLSTAQIAAAAEASKVQAQNYVMQQLQQGKAVMLPESWLQKYTASDTATKWLTPILIVGGVGLLAYALLKLSKRKGSVSSAEAEFPTTIQGLGSVPTGSLSEADAAMAASNPRRRRRKNRRRR